MEACRRRILVMAPQPRRRCCFGALPSSGIEQFSFFQAVTSAPQLFFPVAEREREEELSDLSLSRAMSFTLKASCRPVAAMAACRPVLAAAGSARRVAPSASRLAPLRPASALKNASLTGLCSSFAGETRRWNYGLALGLLLLRCSSSSLVRHTTHAKCGRLTSKGRVQRGRKGANRPTGGALCCHGDGTGGGGGRKNVEQEF